MKKIVSIFFLTALIFSCVVTTTDQIEGSWVYKSSEGREYQLVVAPQNSFSLVVSDGDTVLSTSSGSLIVINGVITISFEDIDVIRQYGIEKRLGKLYLVNLSNSVEQMLFVSFSEKSSPDTASTSEATE